MPAPVQGEVHVKGAPARPQQVEGQEDVWLPHLQAVFRNEGPTAEARQEHPHSDHPTWPAWVRSACSGQDETIEKETDRGDLAPIKVMWLQ